ncbi:transcription factor IIF subunit tfg1 [Mucor circinelloides]
MSSIYNTSRTDKGKGRAVPRRGGGGPMRPGVGPQRMLQQHQLQMQQQQQQTEDITYSEFQLVSTSKRGKNHLMDFKGGSKHVEPKNFARPVKLHRKETNFLPYRQYIQNLNEQNAAAAAAKEAAAANAAAIMAGTPLPHPATKPAASEVEDLGGDAPTPNTQNQHGPKTGADTSLIAPLGGATRNKQMLFKKRTKQIYLAKEDTRELKEQEQRPWILEDYDGQNSFTGTYEGGQRSDYMFFVLTESGFKVMPVDRWYKFQPKRNFKTLSLEEAEEQLKKQQKRESSRWLMLKRQNEMNEAEEAARPSKLKLVDHDDQTKPDPDEDSGNRQDSDMDDLDFDDVFQDDDEATAEHEVEDEDVKDSKDRVKKEIKDYSISGAQEDADDAYDDMGKLTSEGKQMRKLVRDLEKNRAYESDDEEGDPYASSAEELDSDNDDDETSENEKEKEKEKKIPVPPKKKAMAASKPMMPKKAHTTKLKKEGMSKPIGRPGSPSLYMKKKEREGSSSPTPRPSSPLGNGRSSPLRPGSSPQHRPALSPPSPSSSQGFKEPTKKRKLEDSSSGESKHRKLGDDDLITEQEVIDTLRGKVMTTKEFLLSFRKRIKKDSRNRDIITTLLRKVAKSNRSSDPNTRTLELKPEYN